METNNDNSETNSQGGYRIIKVGIILLLLLSPIVYLFVKTSEPLAPQGQSQTNQQTNMDIPSLEKAVNENPTFDNLINVSMAYIKNQMPNRSIEPLQRALQLNPNSSIAYNDLGVAYIEMQQYQEGIDACNKALSIDPAFQLAKNNLKWGMDEKNKASTAIKTQEQMPADKKTIAYYIDNGMSYYKAGNYDKAIEVWSKIADIDKKNVVALNNIGSAFMMKHQVDDAIALFKQAIEYDPKNQLAKNNLAWAMGEKNKGK